MSTRKAATAAPIAAVALTMPQTATAMGCAEVDAYRLASEGLLKTFVIHRTRYATPRAIEQCILECERRGAVLPPVAGNARRRRSMGETA